MINLKKTKRSSKATRNKNDEIFAKKVISQTIICIVIFVMVFANSNLHNSISIQINDGIKYYLCASVDWSKAISSTKTYIENIMNNQQSVPVNKSDALDTEENNQ